MGCHNTERFTKREVKEIIIAWMVLGFSFAAPRIGYSSFFTVLTLYLLALAAGFVGHEVAHKLTAQRYGCSAEFHAWTYGLVLALLFAITFRGFVFAAPGAVYIYATYNPYFGKRENGLISLSGPLVNIASAALFYLLVGFQGMLGLLGSVGFHINLSLAAFNMLPMPPIDGYKVFDWNKLVWAIVAIPAWLVLFSMFSGVLF